MKYGWYETINNTVHYYQTYFNIAVIIDQISDYNYLLREQANMDKAACIMQNNNSSEEKMHESRMSASAKEYAPYVSYDTNLNNESKDMNEDQWVQPKNCMPTKCFLNQVQIKKSGGRIIMHLLH